MTKAKIAINGFGRTPQYIRLMAANYGASRLK